MDYNLERLDNFVYHQCGNAIHTAIKIHGVKDFLKLVSERQTLLNKKYTYLMDTVGTVEKDPILDYLEQKESERRKKRFSERGAL